MSNKKNREPELSQETLLKRLIELTERNMLITLYLAGANRDQMKAAVGVGTQKVDKIISTIKSLRGENKDGKLDK